MRYTAPWPTGLVVAHTNGTVLYGAADFPRGNPENLVTTEEREAKFVALVAPCFGADVAQRGIALIHAIDDCEDMATHFRDLMPNA